VKGHYYSSELSFYNFPYAFGQLFGLGVYALSEREGEGFGSRYDELLVATGQNAAPAVTGSIGCDITTEAFWQQSVDVIASYVERFCDLTGYTGA
jgi:oligoendopeptidase F